ncbi:forkhead box protein N3 isoform X2 [Patella vulgata]|uniref:forkhead box protein N3 isoform X2 n=1 Tax=Patella vulgata TaxID=6465 RepID=UPI00217F6635|nr:forkhead box protein N3 isoform X2 [Patella vulgata]
MEGVGFSHFNMAPIRDVDESDASMRQRLVNSLSQSFPGSALSKALACMDSDDEDLKDPLSSSCFAEMRLEKGELDDDELTSLSWLQETDLLKSLSVEEEEIKEEQKENEEFSKLNGGLLAQSHPPHVPYNPQKHINSKPPYSFSCLIFMAVEDSPQKRLPVKDIYNWILSHFPYFQNAPTGWKNSVRHNLSLNKCFKKVDKEKGQSIGKGSLWCIDPDYRPNLLQALRKTPYHPYHQLQMMSAPSTQNFTGLPGFGINRPLPLTARPAPNTISPHLFPFLSKRLGLTGSTVTGFSIDREIQDVAHTLVSMKGLSSKHSSGHSSDGSDYSSPPSPTDAAALLKQQCRKASANYLRKINSGKPIICTINPSEDHTYSASTLLMEDCPSSPTNSSIDDEYDFGPGGDDSDNSADYHSDYDYGSDGEGDEVDGDAPVHVPKITKIPARPSKPTPTRPAATPIKTRKRKQQSSSRSDDDEDEQKKIAEGADALMNLAGIFVQRQEPRQTRSCTKRRRGNEI